jgi:DNA-directed RNA polymerase subunit RPC12/RpoP
MSDIKFMCPHCGQHIEAPEEMVDQVVDCPACQKQMTVPLHMAQATTQKPTLVPPPPLPPPAAQTEKTEVKYPCPDCNSCVELTETPKVNKMMDWLLTRPAIFFLFGLLPLLFVLIALLFVHAFHGYRCINCGRVSFLKLPIKLKIYTFILRFLAIIVAIFVLRIII